MARRPIIAYWCVSQSEGDATYSQYCSTRKECLDFLKANDLPTEGAIIEKEQFWSKEHILIHINEFLQQ